MIHFPEPVVFFFWSRGRVALGTGMHRQLFEIPNEFFPIMKKIWGKIFPFWGDFGVLLGKKCLLFFYIPIFFPQLFPSYSLYRGIIGTCESQYRGITGTCKSQYTGVIDTRKIHQRVIIGQIPLRGNFWDMENPLWGEIMWNSCPKIDFGRQFWYFFPNRLYSQIVNYKKFSVMGESPAIFFLQESGKIYFFISWKLLYHYGGWSFKSFTYFLLT